METTQSNLKEHAESVYPDILLAAAGVDKTDEWEMIRIAEIIAIDGERFVAVDIARDSSITDAGLWMTVYNHKNKTAHRSWLPMSSIKAVQVVLGPKTPVDSEPY